MSHWWVVFSRICFRSNVVFFVACALVYFIQIGHLKKGLNPPSFADLVFVSPYLSTAIKTGIITGVIALAVSNQPYPLLFYVFLSDY